MDRPVDAKPVKKLRVRHQDRITLDESSMKIVDSWIEQMNGCNHGISLNANKFVNWVIKNQHQELSATQRKDLELKFFDSVKFAKWALSHVKEARKRGENLSIKIVKENEIAAIKSDKAKVTRKKVGTTASDGRAALPGEMKMDRGPN